ncbi:MAG: histidine phosphatase family protein [Clostridiales bacterium]|nr:histidine phosphatase family protein [Clostridiales bacterium]
MEGFFIKLTVVRHGETEYNAQDRYAGSLDADLNQNGIRQAEQLGRDLSRKRFDVVVSSPLKRAVKTAEMINAALHLPVILLDSFSERNMGVYEGLTREEARILYPDIWMKNISRNPDEAPDGGETIRQFDQRVALGLNKLTADYPDKCVLLVCHGLTARVINRRIKGLSFADMHTFTLANCGIAEYSVQAFSVFELDT